MEPSSKLLVAVALLLAACSNEVTRSSEDRSEVDVTDPVLVQCAGHSCKIGEDCCLVSGACFDPLTNPKDCPIDPAFEPSKGAVACSANSQCGTNEYCNSNSCLGLGYCASTTECGSCDGDECVLCACDGKTYSSKVDACNMGVRVALDIPHGACGQTQATDGYTSQGGGVATPCGQIGQCPSGLECCFWTSQCYDPTWEGTCVEPPAGTDFPCLVDDQCGAYYCHRTACDGSVECCAGPGGCKKASPADCSGGMNPVCGCDGMTYINAACANASLTNVAAVGECMN